MPGEVKVYRISGMMRFAHSGERRKFSIEVTALKVEHAVEKVLNELGSRHKVKRSHVRILNVEEINPEEASRPEVKDLLSLERLVVS